MGAEFVRQLNQKCLGLDELWLIARRNEKMEELKKESKRKIRIFCVDVTKEETYVPFLSALQNEKPKVRILINCAGYGKIGLFSTIEEEAQLGMIDVNCKGLTKMTQKVLPYMTKKSYLIFLASVASFMPQPSFAVYAATKAYVLSFGRAMRQELKRRMISVTCVCPGPVDTEFFDHAGDEKSVYGIKKFFLADKEKVVAKALKDAFSKKEISVYSLPMQSLFLATKLVPHRFAVWFYADVIQKFGKDE